jgi:hypothetical protein
MRQAWRQTIRRKRPQQFWVGVEGWLRQRVMEEITIVVKYCNFCTLYVIVKNTCFSGSGINHWNTYASKYSLLKPLTYGIIPQGIKRPFSIVTHKNQHAGKNAKYYKKIL